MSGETRSLGTRVGPAALRWGFAGLVIAGAHLGAGWVIVNWQRAEAAMGEPPAAIMIELAPLAVAPEATPQEVAPGPEMVEAEPEPEKPVEKPPEPEPVQDMTPVEEPPPPPEPEIKLPDLPPIPDAAAVLAPPEPEKPKPEKPKLEKPKPKPRVVEKRKPINPEHPRARQTTAPPTAQAQLAPTAAAPAAGAASTPSVSPASWRGSLMAHLNRYKRFPGGASPGTVQVSFSIDRNGRVLSARLLRGSGEPQLDQEAVAMIQRASPVPAPPDGLGGGVIALSVPVRFSR